MASALWARSQANISLLFAEVPFERRAAAAATAGFEAIECWWPFTVASPPPAEVDAFVASVADAGVALRGLNFFAGDMPGGDRGVVSNPSRRSEFDDSMAVAVDIGARLGVTAFNALYGNRVPGLSTDEQDEAALDALTAATEQCDAIGATVLVEPVSGVGAYPLKLAGDALAVITKVRERTQVGRIALLADLYHLTVNGDDVRRVVTDHVDRIGHVQIADAPGRHEPGTGAADIIGLVDLLEQSGYTGGLGLEYVPSGDTVAGLAWLYQLAPGLQVNADSPAAEMVR
ncbi:hydroxypyruvate isomerase family protein [Mycolicibacterium sp. 050158]|uniref:hydroxypyruvate isomerase family protein n=1 Tax=Mycolicibacterium sp. 050158 TaxID=3090602 RepID=UPI00299CD6A8|nr:TIM barrel protein [Mycolicibacterium sp. 050158]MDX1893056.1 TIM barrel protein [Mycolicibacterium sp. 050158]